MDLSEWAQIVKVFVTHVNDDQSSSTPEEVLNNQVDRMIHFVDNLFHHHVISWSFPIIYQPEVTVLIDIWNGLLRTQFQCQLGENTMRR